MDFSWIDISLGETVWIGVAFLLGFLSRSVGLPPMIGYLLTGFLLGANGIAAGDALQKIADLGITLLLFTIGLKLNLRTLARPQVWAVASIHMVVVCILLGLGLFGLATAGLAGFAGLDLWSAVLVAFALSFSSTVFVVKTLEDRGEVASLHGRIAVGVLIVQDIAAVLFLAVSTAKVPSMWALLLIVALFPLRKVLFRILDRVGHGELLVLFGMVLAVGGAELFEYVSLKGDLGALVLGVLISNHARSDELNKTMMGFKDLFLLGFFLTIGMSGSITAASLTAAVLLVPVVLIKSALFFALFARFRLRARTSLLASINLGNFSEFGLIVAALAAVEGWITGEWLITIAVAVSLSFVVAALANRFNYRLFDRFRATWIRFQHPDRLYFDQAIEITGAKLMVIGMGGVGTGTYDRLQQDFPGEVAGVDTDLEAVSMHVGMERRVIRGDPSDADFWDRVVHTGSVELVMLTLPKLDTSLETVREIRRSGYTGGIAAIARYSDEVKALQDEGVDAVFNIYSEAGMGFGEHGISRIQNDIGDLGGL
jgi:predicted Kef-type K+ transport protein